MSEKTINDMIDAFADDEELPLGDRLKLFVAMCDGQKIKDALVMKGRLAEMGMVAPDIIDGFAYGVLRIGQPHLFEPVASQDESTGEE